MRADVATIGLRLMTLGACAGREDASYEWPAEVAAERLGLEICQRDGVEEPLLCGSASMPADRADPGGSKVDISFLVVPAKNGNPDNRVWTEHQGGPGSTSTGCSSRS